jgi:ATP-binding cassette subfamily B (MDR/TAP) protein 1
MPSLAVDTSAAAELGYELDISPRSSLYTSNLSISDYKHSPTSSQHSIPSAKVVVGTPASAPAPTPSIRLLFSLISSRQRFLLLLPAILSSIIAGGVAPFMTYVIGKSFDAFGHFPRDPNPPQSAKDTLLRGVGLAALELVGLAVASIALSSITSSLWIWTGEHNVMALRKLVYESVTQKDMVWFDTKMGSEGTVQATEGDQGPLGAGGLMAKFTRYVSVIYATFHFTNPPQGNR